MTILIGVFSPVEVANGVTYGVLLAPRRLAACSEIKNERLLICYYKSNNYRPEATTAANRTVIANNEIPADCQ